MDPHPIYAVHGENDLAYHGWTITTHGLGHDPTHHGGHNFRPIRQRGRIPIARLNNGYGAAGTIPLHAFYPAFATRCANFVRASQGCHAWIIGNEPNLSVERPDGVPITPSMYAECYTLCRDAIRALPYPTHRATGSNTLRTSKRSCL